MCKLGLFDYMRQVGTVKVHGQGTLSNVRYNELKSAQKMIKNYIKDSNARVDIYDAQSVPADKFVYVKQPDSVYVEYTDLLHDKTKTGEFMDRNGGEPVLRQIFKFIEKADGAIETPIDKMKETTLVKLHNYTKKMKMNTIKSSN